MCISLRKISRPDDLAPGICAEGMRWRSWLRHCTTSRNVEVSIPDDVIGIFH